MQLHRAFCAFFFLMLTASVLAAAPAISSLTPSPGSDVNANNSLTFSAAWSDADSNSAKLWVCKTNSATTSGCATGQEWCSGTLSTTTPQTCSITVPASLKGSTTQYHAFLCEDTGGECSAVSSGTFNVAANHAPVLGSIDANVSAALNGMQIKVSATGVSDADSDTLSFYCAFSANPSSANTGFCSKPGVNSSGYGSIFCEGTAGSGNETKTIYCALFDADTNSDVKTNAYEEDNSAPAQPGTPSVSASSGQVTVSNYSVSGATQYRILRGTSGTDVNVLITTTAQTTYTDTGLTNTTTYYYRVQAVDAVGNASAISPQSNGVTPQPPNTITPGTVTISSSTHDQNKWGSSDDPRFTWNDVNNANGYSCVFDQTSSTEPDTSADSECDRDITYENKVEGTWYFHVRACNSAASTPCGSTTHYQMGIDKTGPGVPEGVNAEMTGNRVRVSWTAPSDNLSGIQRYTVYRSKDNAFDVIDAGVKKYENLSGTEFFDSDSALLNGIAYYYRVQATDGAGNAGSIAAQKKIVFEPTALSCTLTYTWSPSAFTTPGDHNVSLTLSAPISKARLGVQKATETTQFILTDQENKTVLSASFPFAEGNYTLHVFGETTDHATCHGQQAITVEGTPPQAQWETNQSPADGRITLNVLATDASGISKIIFFEQQGTEWEQIGEVTSGTANLYAFEWTTALSEATVKARTIDWAGNQTEITQSVEIPQSASEEFVFSLTESEEKKWLESSGLTAEAQKAVQELLQKVSAIRKIKLVPDNNGYKLVVEDTITNTGDSNQALQLLLNVPKSLATSAGEIKADLNGTLPITVILEDPVVS
ncbi:MAG: fibronectin type III domain-containing protein, partial [Candidatus Diapherotrites archaeon]|nr:fibronectin type III domain-containing protein [Candidatus Diapherotrites archaeon]